MNHTFVVKVTTPPNASFSPRRIALLLKYYIRIGQQLCRHNIADTDGNAAIETDTLKLNIGTPISSPTVLTKAEQDQLVKILSTAAASCSDALEEVWDRTNDGFRAMKTSLEKGLTILGEPLPQRIKEPPR